MSLLSDKLTHLLKGLKTAIYRDPLPITGWQICDNLPYGVPQPAPADPRWRALAVRETWGDRLTWAWLQADAAIPPEFVGKPVALHLVLDFNTGTKIGAVLDMATGPEGLVFVEGIATPLQAINLEHDEVLLAEQCPGDLPIHIAIEAFSGISNLVDHRALLRTADLVWIDREVEALYWDAHVLLETAKVLPDASDEKDRYLRILDLALRLLDWRTPDQFSASVLAARAALQDQVYQCAPLSGGPLTRPVVHALGHAHLDVAWLWPLSVTRGKAIRTFSTALALMDQYAEYCYTQSQAYLYQKIAEDRPDVFARIKARTVEGRWEATGATWVEMDTNLPSGEALVRQFLLGMRYFQQELGVRPNVLWLPDVFGYSGALPQIMKLAGVENFYTSKLSWNGYTHYPYDTFWWEGIDGSRVLTHLATTPELHTSVKGRGWRTYCAKLVPEEMLHTWTDYAQKNMNNHVMVAYGFGDGGGGPTRDMIERRARMADLPGLPQVRHSTARAFFQALRETIPADLPRWVGELYFQMHRGTYTSQAAVKRGNRKTEVLLHNAEALASMSYLLGQSYPQPELNHAWEILLLNQFHDILPGSSISEVYRDAARDYQSAQISASSVLEQALGTITQHIRYDSGMQGFAVFNTLGTTVGGPVEVTLQGSAPVEIVGPSGEPQPFQWLDTASRRALLFCDRVSSYGHIAYAVRPVERERPFTIANEVSATPTRLENGLLRAEFDAQGHLIRLQDLENLREVLDGAGNQLWAYVDRPHQWDAWEVEEYVHDQGWQIEPESVAVLESGPLRAALEITYSFNQSRIRQRVILYAGERVLHFETEVDWHEEHTFLQTHFPLAVRSMSATYEIQFGSIQRPTHRNTAWEAAQFEVPAQTWADLSEGNYGVSLLNDSKYGYSARDNVLTLSLLRSATQPDTKTADQGQQVFTYALYPHTGDWRSDVIAQAKRLNHPLIVQAVQGGGTWLPVEFSLVNCPTPGVIIDTVKKAEDSDSLIVRVYEAHGGRLSTSLVFASRIQSAEEVNLLEEPVGPVNVMVDTLRFSLTPFQIRSFRVKLHDIIEHQIG